MKIKMVAVILLIVSSAYIFIACEHYTEFVENGIKYCEWNGEVIVEGFENEESAVKHLVIKGTVEISPKYYMWFIWDSAFENTEIESLIIEYYKAETNYFYSEGYGALTFDKIGECAFKNCKKLKTVSFPYGMTTIERQAFYGCESLETVTFPYCLKTIGDEAFGACSSLTEVFFDEKLESIGEGAFNDCNDNFTIHFKGKPPKADGELFENVSNLTILVAEKHLEEYTQDEYWSKYADRIAAE